MIAILVIIGVVGAISCYDFLSTRNWQQVTSRVRNETVFENRNREYGAYRIRRDYNRNFILILLGMVGGVGVIYGAATTFREPMENDKAAKKTDDVTFTMDLTEIDEPEIPEVKQPEPAAPQRMEMTKFDLIVVSDTRSEIKPPVVDSNTVVGTVTQSGTKDPWLTAALPGTGGNGTGTGTPGGDTPAKPYNGAQLDEPAEYIGGGEARALFLRKNLRFPEVPREEGRGGKSWVKFVVKKSGEVDNVSLAKKNPNCPECDNEAVRVVKLMPRWKPGKKDGKDVDSWFNLPLVFDVE